MVFLVAWLLLCLHDFTQSCFTPTGENAAFRTDAGQMLCHIPARRSLSLCTAEFGSIRTAISAAWFAEMTITPTMIFYSITISYNNAAVIIITRILNNKQLHILICLFILNNRSMWNTTWNWEWFTVARCVYWAVIDQLQYMVITQLQIQLGRWGSTTIRITITL